MLFQKVQLANITRGSDKGLALNRRQDITWTNDAQVYWHTYLSLGFSGLINMSVTLSFIKIIYGMYMNMRILQQRRVL